MTRTGKIARLPRALRDTLNRRLLEGEPGPRLLAWLNKQPETKAVLAEDFDGRAVTAQNLSEWRLGGFGDWCREQTALEAVGRTLEEGSDFEALAGHGLLPDR
ncbi:MAG: hypothetical protein NTV51_12605, partial [Verrucomicrobia bacterium]|nr:hypothetical protein [Verrucomicrobiota bacterium]